MVIYCLFLIALSVKDRVDAPQFLEVPESITTLTGNNVSFACKVVGKPTPKISWKKGKKSIKESKTVTVLNVEEENRVISELQLQDVEPLKSEDVYTIEAENKAGKISHEVHLTGVYLIS